MNRNRSIELLEESLQILRGAGAPVLLQYWTGSVPFAIALLLLLHDAALSWGAALLLRDSLACTVAFVWLSYWKSRTSRSLFALLAPGSDVPVAWPQRALLQTIFQTLKLFVMPLAAASILAWPAASAFFRTLALEPPFPEVRPIRNAFGRAFTAATQRYSENVVAFLAVAALTVITCLNVLVALFLLPGLWKMLTGYETDWSRLEDPTLFGLLAVAGVAGWLLIDPWIQTYCVLRVFYQNARTDGRDLLREIARLAVVPLLCFLALASPGRVTGEATQASLNRSIDRVSKSPDYGWLRPQESKTDKGFLADLAQKVNAGVKVIETRIETWGRTFTNWLRRGSRGNQPAENGTSPSPAHARQLRWILIILAILICGAIIALFLPARKAPPPNPDSAAGTAVAADVLNEQILPSDVKHEEWLRLALEYLANNQTRLAARAFYLANLSYLGSQGMLSLSLTKTNKVYERELARQPKSSESSTAFITGNRLYERAWFGMRELAAEQIELLKGAADQLRHHA
jgi:hypothetical protein